MNNLVVGAIMRGTSASKAVMGGMNPLLLIVSGLGAMPTDSVGYSSDARCTIASGNLLADLRFNVTVESQGGCK